MSESERIWAEFRALAGRVAKLESCNCRHDAKCPHGVGPTFEELVAKAGPLSTGQLASAESPPARIDQLDWLRRNGWTVAVHNDYRIDGVPMTFWLLTHPDGRWVKGEGRNDAQALQAARDSMSKYSPNGGTNPAMPDAELTTAKGDAVALPPSGVAGEGLVPPGWKLSPGWKLALHPWQCRVDDCHAVASFYSYLITEGVNKVCAAHAVAMGALVQQTADEIPEVFLCSEDGPGVTVDEDGCCIHCGEDATVVPNPALMRDELPTEHKFGCASRKGGACDCPVEVEQDGDEDGPPAEQPTACHVCGEPATCIGAYEDAQEDKPACDKCCAHGNEDGRCEPLAPSAEQPSNTPAILRSLTEAERAGFPVLSDEAITAALAEGERARWMAEHPTMAYPEPAEQPSRQETPGGEAIETHPAWCGTRTLDHSEDTEHGPDWVVTDVERASTQRCWCSPACRDRAKAKAAEQSPYTWNGVPTIEPLPGVVANHVPTVDDAVGRCTECGELSRPCQCGRLVAFAEANERRTRLPTEPPEAGQVDKAAEQEQCPQRGPFMGWKRCGRSAGHTGQCQDGEGHSWWSPAAASGAGQVPSAPVCKCGSPNTSASTDWCRNCGKCWRTEPPAPAAPNPFEQLGGVGEAARTNQQAQPPAPDECKHGNSAYDECPSCDAETPDCDGEGMHQPYCRRAGGTVEEPAFPMDQIGGLPQPPAPAVGTLSERMRDFNDGSRRFADEAAALEARLASQRRHLETWDRYHREEMQRVERERDEWAQGRRDAIARLDKVREERDEATAKLAQAEWALNDETRGKLALRRLHGVRENETWRDFLTRVVSERDEATAKERARCLAVVDTYEPRAVASDWSISGALNVVAERIRSGAPAPGMDG